MWLAIELEISVVWKLFMEMLCGGHAMKAEYDKELRRTFKEDSLEAKGGKKLSTSSVKFSCFCVILLSYRRTLYP